MQKSVYSVSAMAAQIQAAAERFQHLVELHPEAERYRQQVSVALFWELDTQKAEAIIQRIEEELQHG